jgi:hypothetical protein
MAGKSSGTRAEGSAFEGAGRAPNLQPPPIPLTFRLPLPHTPWLHAETIIFAVAIRLVPLEERDLGMSEENVVCRIEMRAGSRLSFRIGRDKKLFYLHGNEKCGTHNSSK